jgi:BRCT domain, a BRCA1 C-terminus domain
MPAFENCCIYFCVPEDLVEGIPDDAALGRQITNAGGTVADSPASATHFVVLNMQQEHVDEFKQLKGELCSVVWYFACIQANKLLLPSTHHLYRPFPAPAIPGATDYGDVTITGFSNTDRLAALTLIQAAGLHFSRVMNYSLEKGSNVSAQSALLIAKDVEGSSKKTATAR